MNFPLIVLIIISAPLGAYLVSLLFPEELRVAFVVICLIGIPGLIFSAAGIFGLFRILAGRIEFSFENIFGSIGAICFGYLFIMITYGCWRSSISESVRVPRINLSHDVSHQDIQGNQQAGLNIYLKCPICLGTIQKKDEAVRKSDYTNCSLCNNRLKVHMQGGLRILLIPINVSVGKNHRFNCPFCNVDLEIAEIKEKVEVQCHSCEQTFNVRP